MEDFYNVDFHSAITWKSVFDKHPNDHCDDHDHCEKINFIDCTALVSLLIIAPSFQPSQVDLSLLQLEGPCSSGPENV